MQTKMFSIYNKVKEMAKYFVSFTLLCLLGACEAENSISTEYRCQFVFYTNFHPQTNIEKALTSTGSFAIITTKYENGAWHVYATLNDSKNETQNIAMTTAIEKNINYNLLGANHGIIIGSNGYGGIDGNSAYLAWDRQCPNCIHQYGGTNYPLTWNQKNRQMVTCAKCQRTYDLNTGAVQSGAKGNDKSLLGYRITYDKVNYKITVWN